MQPFGITSLTIIIKKIIYHDICDSKISWDKTLPDWIVRYFHHIWYKTFYQKFEVLAMGESIFFFASSLPVGPISIWVTE